MLALAKASNNPMQVG